MFDQRFLHRLLSVLLETGKPMSFHWIDDRVLVVVPPALHAESIEHGWTGWALRASGDRLDLWDAEEEYVEEYSSPDYSWLSGTVEDVVKYLSAEVPFHITLSQLKRQQYNQVQDPLVTPRPASRIPRLLEKIGQLWKRQPDARLGQLLQNAGAFGRGDVFFVEDDEVEQAIDAALGEKK